MSRIRELENQIRDLINEPRRRAAIRKNDEDWKRLSRSLDALGDTEMAFEAYSQMPDSDPPGSSYMLVYGFVQALSIQQDAVRDLHKALSVSYRRDPVLDEIRDVRNAVTHQTDGRNKKEFRLIARSTLSKSGFRLFKATPDKLEEDSQHVSLEELLDKQRAPHEHALKALVEALCKQEMEYRERFRDEPLTAVLRPELDSYFEQAREAARGKESWEFGIRHMALIREALERFHTALAKRQLTGVYDNIEYLSDQIKCPLEQLAQFFEAHGKEQLSAREALIHIAFVQSRVAKLRTAAREIDEEIAGPVEVCSN